MSNIDLQDVNNFEVLQWNVAENITGIEEKVMILAVSRSIKWRNIFL